MKTLDTKEWIAVVVAVFVVGFFFLFGQYFLSLINNDNTNQVSDNTPEVLIEETAPGTGDLAVAGKRVVVHYTGRFVDGTVFDSSVNRKEPFQFVLGVGQVIEGWDKGIEGMRVGGRRLLSVPPELGYGMNDYGPIPGGSTLIFEVELLKVE
ncbi:MAG: FKBP-type peptidyl-prolyl cis-trans isomerase [Patescibacteria group bacterium]